MTPPPPAAQGSATPSLPFPVRFAADHGVYYGWVVLATSFLISFCEMSTFNPVLSLFILPMAADFGWSRSEFTGVVLVATFAAAGAAPVAGRLVDRFGSRVVLVIGSAILAASLLGLTFTQNIVQFYLLYAVSRMMGTSTTGLANTAVISNWFQRRRGTALGLMATGWRVGSAALPLMLAGIISAYSWREGWLALGIITTVFAIVPPLLLTRARPEDFGLEPDGGKTYVGGVEVVEEESWTAKEAARSPILWLLAVVCLCSWYTGAAYNLHLVPYLIGRGYSPEVAVGTLAGYGSVGIPSTLLAGWVSDKLGIRVTFIGIFALATVGSFFCWWLSADWMLVGFMVCFGAAFGGVLTVQQSVWATYFGRKSVGTIRGITMPVQLMGNAFGPFAAAAIFDLTGSYTIPFFSFVVVSVLGGVLMFFARKPKRPLAAPGPQAVLAVS